MYRDTLTALIGSSLLARFAGNQNETIESYAWQSPKKYVVDFPPTHMTPLALVD